MAKQDVEAGLITAQDLPKLAEAGHIEAPAVGHDAKELRQAVEAALVETWGYWLGPTGTAKGAGKAGKWAADKLTDKGKDIEDKATHKEKDARDEAHKKINEDKAKKKGKEASAALGSSAHAFASALSDLRA
ncbi:hypothetical protein EJ065_1915 [Corallococcus coralloides]|uniref:Uncharacterized protein n=1 Tax=Corallococcus coralloides TaxID=184914 RepID=A0A410RNH2_CORCK|nr:hypothetical protein [Corallococcus coralloides]QAT83507.1 hypothetical protein EJ065_1915 [Corallococcus coralloides]